MEEALNEKMFEEDQSEDGKGAEEEIMCGKEQGEEGLSPEAMDELDVEVGREPKKLTAPPTVSQKMKDEHEHTHCPYAPWCEYCVRGRCIKRAHYALKDKDEEAEVPRVDIDYFYMSKEDKNAKQNPVVVMINEKSNEKYARAAGQAGVGEDGKWTGLSRISPRS